MATRVAKKDGERLQGKVAQLLNERELVINIGESDGVRTGMKFKVLSDAPVDIYDPETNKLLGTVDREKVRVQAVEVEEKYTICKTYRTRYVAENPFYQFRQVQVLSEPSSYPRTIPETLKAKDSQHLAPLSEEESYVKRGDRVIELVEDDE